MFRVLIFFFCLYSCACTAQQSELYPSLDSGTIAPELKGKDARGKTFRLSKLKSRLTLLYFYEVNCHLCAEITPGLKKLYNAYKNSGLELIAIPVNSARADWISHVLEQKAGWKDVFLNPSKSGTYLELYKVTVSPTFYLLDKKKVLLTRRMGRLEQVEEQMNSRLR